MFSCAAMLTPEGAVAEAEAEFVPATVAVSRRNEEVPDGRERDAIGACGGDHCRPYTETAYAHPVTPDAPGDLSLNGYGAGRRERYEH